MSLSNAALELLTRVDKILYSGPKYTHYLPCDAFLCFCYLNPEIRILKQSSYHIEIELHNGITRGLVVVDHLKTKKPNVVIIESFNEDLFKMHLINMSNEL